MHSLPVNVCAGNNNLDDKIIFAENHSDQLRIVCDAQQSANRFRFVNSPCLKC